MEVGSRSRIPESPKSPSRGKRVREIRVTLLAEVSKTCQENIRYFLSRYLMRLASFADDSQAQVLEDCSRGSGRDLFNFREAFRKRTPVKQILHIRNEEPTNRRFEFQKRGQQFIRVQRNAFHRRDVRQQSRSFAL